VIKALGYELLDLQRVKEGESILGDLKEGEWRIELLEE
jgi:16S rRNA U516 pseudouridylate synthase RsuA-like enzyme